tara:strand:- start:9232 stop:10455 length:1224 start_codon:yes stop_codon:yes gene_type:complete
MQSKMNLKSGRIVLKILLPIIFVLFAVAFALLLYRFKKDPDEKGLGKILPRVEVAEITAEPLSLTIESQGTVQSRIETVLTAEVSGIIERVSPQLFPGSFFEKHDVLLEIDKVDYEAALANAKSLLASAKLAYAQEKSWSEQAEVDWKELGRGTPSDLVVRKPQLEKAKADLESAEAVVAVAERNLSKTIVRAPYDGRVHSKLVGVGQNVSARMTQIARIYSVDVAEVRLPISGKEAGYIELPETFRGGKLMSKKAPVTLMAEFGGKDWSWQGTIDRVEGVIDPATRQVFLVARVEDPYAQGEVPGQPPLKVGQFVNAEIYGKELGQGFIIPRSALKPNDEVWIVDENNRLRITHVSVAKAGVREVYVTAGLQGGDRICLTQLGIVIDGMEVFVENQLNADQLRTER